MYPFKDSTFLDLVSEGRKSRPTPDAKPCDGSTRARCKSWLWVRNDIFIPKEGNPGENQSILESVPIPARIVHLGIAADPSRARQEQRLQGLKLGLGCTFQLPRRGPTGTDECSEVGGPLQGTRYAKPSNGVGCPAFFLWTKRAAVGPALEGRGWSFRMRRLDRPSVPKDESNSNPSVACMQYSILGTVMGMAC